MITKYDVKRVLVDNICLVDVLFYDAFVRINLSKNQLKEVFIPLVYFSRNLVRVEGQIILSIIAGTPPR